MTEDEKTLTTAQYSAKTGVAVSTVARMLRQGKIRGEKRSGKWAIFASELSGGGGNNQALSGPRSDTQPDAGQTYDVESFARRTYLTDNGVRKWLRSGRLAGHIDSHGSMRIDASNLERPDFKHLVR